MDSNAIGRVLDILQKPPPPRFTLPENRFLKRVARRRLAAGMVGIKKLIKPKNALVLLPNLPRPGECTEVLLNGDFILGDMIPVILGARGASPHLRTTTLSLSPGNATDLVSCHRSGLMEKLTIVVSHYFRHGEGEIYERAKVILKDVCPIAVCRMHCKVILIPTTSGDWYVIRGSANLRSSNCLEQITIDNDRELHDFHAAWIDEIAASPLE